MLGTIAQNTQHRLTSLQSLDANTKKSHISIFITLGYFFHSHTHSHSSTPMHPVESVPPALCAFVITLCSIRECLAFIAFLRTAWYPLSFSLPFSLETWPHLSVSYIRLQPAHDNSNCTNICPSERSTFSVMCQDRSRASHATESGDGASKTKTRGTRVCVLPGAWGDVYKYVCEPGQNGNREMKQDNLQRARTRGEESKDKGTDLNSYERGGLVLKLYIYLLNRNTTDKCVYQLIRLRTFT